MGDKTMKLVVIDGQGGGIGKGIIEAIAGELTGWEIIAVGTNALATAQMLKAGATVGATGENAVVYNCQRADFIVGAMGIIVANSMYGEISPAMAAAVSGSRAKKLLLPMNKCGAVVVGTQEKPLSAYFAEIVDRLREI